MIIRLYIYTIIHNCVCTYIYIYNHLKTVPVRQSLFSGKLHGWNSGWSMVPERGQCFPRHHQGEQDDMGTRLQPSTLRPRGGGNQKNLPPFCC